MAISPLSRRAFIAASASAAVSLGASKVPVGLELYSVRDEMDKDLLGTVRAVAKMGYQVVEFYSPYYSWTVDRAKEIRKLMDDLGIRCLSTHNSNTVFTPDGLPKAIELNQIIGSKYIVMASAGRVTGIDGWKGVAEKLIASSEKLKPLGMRAGFHNHKAEFVAIEGTRPMDILAGTPQDITLQLDVGTCIEAGVDPVAWINSHPGRITSIHCKDWAPGEGKGYRVLTGEGVAPWKEIIKAAESKGGVEFYLIEQEGSRLPSLETAKLCLDNWKKLRS
jgi:sugar phosphate isomerase/epimerase